MTLRNKILKMWIDKGIIENEATNIFPSQLWKTAKKFAKAICDMDGDQSEKLHFADEITKIYE